MDNLLDKAVLDMEFSPWSLVMGEQTNCSSVMGGQVTLGFVGERLCKVRGSEEILGFVLLADLFWLIVLLRR